MRFCSASAVRILTLFSLVVLTSHSFVLVNAAAGDPPSDVAITPTLTTSPPTSPSVTSTPPATSVSPTGGSSSSDSSPPSKSSSPPSSPSPSETPPDSQTSPPSTSPTSSVASSVSSSPSASESSDSGTSSTPTSSGSSSTSSSSSGTSSGSSTVSRTSNASQATGLTVAAGLGASAPAVQTSAPFTNVNVSIEKPTGTGSAMPSDTAAASNDNASSGFLHNKGAMAGVFTVVAVVGLAIIAYIVFKVVKRRARMRDEEDDMFFEKYQEPEPGLSAGHGPSDSSYNVATTAATAEAYPDRTTHYGAAGVGAYQNTQQYAAEYPPGTAYAAAAQSGEQYQYSGQVGAYNAAAGQSGEQYQYASQGNYNFTTQELQQQTTVQYQYPNHADAYTGTAGYANQSRSMR